MQTDSQHIIHKLTLEVSASSVEQGHEIKDNMRSFFDTHVVPAIERYFTGLTSSMSADEVIQMDKLELTVNSGQNGWNITGLGQAIQLEFDKAVSVTRSGLADSSSNKKTTTDEIDPYFGNASTLVDAPKVENLKVFTKSEHGVLAWISFLNDGTTSWFTNEMLESGSGAQEEQLLKSIVQEMGAVSQKQQFVFGTSQARSRLIAQFSDHFLISLVTAVNKNAVSINYSSVLPEQRQPITELILELLRGSDTPTRTRFWEVVFGMTQLDTSQTVLSEVAFLAVMEQLFPKAINLIKSGKSGQKKESSGKSTGKKAEQTNAGSVSTSSAGESSLVLQDVSIIGIRLLEWMDILQSKPVSLKKYSTLQASLLESKRVSPDSLTSVDSKPSKIVESSNSREVAAKEIHQSPVDEKRRTGPKDVEENTSSTAEKSSQELAADLNEKPSETSNALPLGNKKVESATEETTTSTDAKKATVPEQEESITKKVDEIQPDDFQANDALSDQIDQAVNPVSESEKKTTDSDHPDDLPKTNKRENAKENVPEPKKKSFKDQDAQLLVENAGLVILHPFLKHFFKGIGLLNEENKLTDKVLAAHVLHYIATGREHDFEQVMLFEKYLVGIDPFESIPREVIISDAIKLEVENLLKAARENWKPLQSSSSAALRETFIQRPGKLINESPNPRLVVERKTVDVLMSQLNWTISIIRLPWLDELIFVEW
ncbi:MAG: contractile injection system tape measure protein [Bacteroidota bacterium]